MKRSYTKLQPFSNLIIRKCLKGSGKLIVLSMCDMPTT